MKLTLSVDLDLTTVPPERLTGMLIEIQSELATRPSNAEIIDTNPVLPTSDTTT